LALALCLASLLLNYSKAQTVQTVNPNTGVVSSTGNLINPTGWNGITYTNTAGVSQCCWGGPAPAMNQDTNTIRFSWGYSTASQIIGINTALANAGSGIKLNGYNYSWTIDNEGATQGTLTGNVSLQGANGQTLESYSYNYNNTNINLQTFSGTQNFTTNYSLSSVSSLDVSFTGKDNRFWAGYYGPRVRDVNVSLNYTSSPSSTGTSTTTPTVPTTTNSSSNNVTVGQTGQTTVTTSSTAVTPPTGQTSSNPTMTSVTTVNAGGANVSSTGTVSAQDGVPQTVKDSVASSSPSAATPTTASTSSSTKAGPSTTAMKALRQAEARDQATQKAALQNSQASLAASTAQAQQSSALAVSVMQGSAASAITATSLSNKSITGSIGLNPFAPSGTGITVNTTSSQQSTPVQTPTFVSQPTQATRFTEVATQDASVGSLGLNRPGNPVNDAMNSRFELSNNLQETKTETVNRNAQQNEAAGAVTIEAMATQPKGFEAYSVTLRDAAFYAPKEVYANQATVDNVRALRQMASERLYQEMLDMQYKIGE